MTDQETNVNMLGNKFFKYTTSCGNFTNRRLSKVGSRGAFKSRRRGLHGAYPHFSPHSLFGGLWKGLYQS